MNVSEIKGKRFVQIAKDQQHDTSLFFVDGGYLRPISPTIKWISPRPTQTVNIRGDQTQWRVFANIPFLFGDIPNNLRGQSVPEWSALISFGPKICLIDRDGVRHIQSPAAMTGFDATSVVPIPEVLEKAVRWGSPIGPP